MYRQIFLVDLSTLVLQESFVFFDLDIVRLLLLHQVDALFLRALPVVLHFWCLLVVDLLEAFVHLVLF